MNCAFCKRPRRKTELVETSVKNELICQSCSIFYNICPFCGSTDKNDGRGEHRKHFNDLCDKRPVVAVAKVVVVPEVVASTDLDGKRLYIEERRSDWSGNKELVKEQAYYGPFSTDELEVRLNDSFADLMAEDGANIEAIEMTDEEAKRYHVNSRSFWMTQLLTLTPA